MTDSSYAASVAFSVASAPSPVGRAFWRDGYGNFYSAAITAAQGSATITPTASYTHSRSAARTASAPGSQSANPTGASGNPWASFGLSMVTAPGTSAYPYWIPQGGVTACTLDPLSYSSPQSLPSWTCDSGAFVYFFVGSGWQIGTSRQPTTGLAMTDSTYTSTFIDAALAPYPNSQPFWKDGNNNNRYIASFSFSFGSATVSPSSTTSASAWPTQTVTILSSLSVAPTGASTELGMNGYLDCPSLAYCYQGKSIQIRFVPLGTDAAGLPTYKQVDGPGEGSIESYSYLFWTCDPYCYPTTISTWRMRVSYSPYSNGYSSATLYPVAGNGKPITAYTGSTPSSFTSWGEGYGGSNFYTYIRSGGSATVTATYSSSARPSAAAAPSRAILPTAYTSQDRTYTIDSRFYSDATWQVGAMVFARVGTTFISTSPLGFSLNYSFLTGPAMASVSTWVLTNPSSQTVLVTSTPSQATDDPFSLSYTSAYTCSVFTQCIVTAFPTSGFYFQQYSSQGPLFSTATLTPQPSSSAAPTNALDMAVYFAGTLAPVTDGSVFVYGSYFEFKRTSYSGTTPIYTPGMGGNNLYYDASNSVWSLTTWHYSNLHPCDKSAIAYNALGPGVLATPATANPSSFPFWCDGLQIFRFTPGGGSVTATSSASSVATRSPPPTGAGAGMTGTLTGGGYSFEITPSQSSFYFNQQTCDASSCGDAVALYIWPGYYLYPCNAAGNIVFGQANPTANKYWYFPSGAGVVLTFTSNNANYGSVANTVSGTTSRSAIATFSASSVATRSPPPTGAGAGMKGTLTGGGYSFEITPSQSSFFYNQYVCASSCGDAVALYIWPGLYFYPCDAAGNICFWSG